MLHAEGRHVNHRPRLLDRTHVLTLTAPELTVLLGGMRALNANFKQSPLGVFTDRPGTLTSDFYVNLLDMSTDWRVSALDENLYEGRDRVSGTLRPQPVSQSTPEG